MRTFLSPTRLSTVAACIAAALAAGCSPEYYRASADRESYAIIEAKSRSVPGMVESFTIEVPEGDPAEAVPEGPLSLEKALEIATLNSRDYQTRKESLYLSALSLTGTRHSYMPNFFGTLSGGYDDTDTADVKRASGSSNFGFTWLLNTGARLTVGLASSASKYLTGDRAESAGSSFSLSITQPILRGFGAVSNEPLTQAERSMLYQVRSFIRYRRTFYVDIVSSYYRVLQRERILQNERVNRDNLRAALERAVLMEEAGQMPPFQVDQTRQDELSASNRLESAEQSFRASLDAFKVKLGLPTEAAITLDPQEEQRLVDAFGAMRLELDADAAVAIALENRLDLMSAGQQVQDVERQVRITRMALLPGLDVTASTNVDTEGDARPLNFEVERTDYSVGVELDLPLDKLSERNAYRRSLIEMDRSRRGYGEQRDQVALAVRDAWRQYHRTTKSYEILEISLALAERRVESTTMLQEEGRASTRDVLESRQALLRAQNAMVEALVDCKLASLQLARDMGILVVDDNGQLEENFDAYR